MVKNDWYEHYQWRVQWPSIKCGRHISSQYLSSLRTEIACDILTLTIDLVSSEKPDVGHRHKLELVDTDYFSKVTHEHRLTSDISSTKIDISVTSY